MKKVKSFLSRYGTDVALVIGAAAIAVGAALIYLPAGLIVGGILVIVGAVLDSPEGGDEA